MNHPAPVARARLVAVVDDDSGVRASLSSLLRALGHDTLTYASAAEFLQALPAHVPHCLISDMRMPGMDGEQLQAALQSAGHDFPVIFLTAFPTDPLRARVLARGAHAFLGKPVEADAIAACLATALASR
jgi:FixJ family two-component response regulator